MRLVPVLVLLALSLLALNYSRDMGLRYDKLDQQRAAIMDGTAKAPYRTRVLTPALFTALMQGNDFTGAYTLFHAVVWPALFAGLYQWLHVWTDTLTALGGCALLAAVLPLMMITNYGAWSGLEAVLLVWFLVLLHRSGGAFCWSMLALVILASLNRETALILPGVYLAVYGRERWRMGLVYLAAWAVVFVGLRLWLGAGEPSLTLAETWRNNTHVPRLDRALEVLPPLILLGVVFAARWLDAPPVARRAAVVAVPYLMIVALFAQWFEVRLWMPVLILGLPLLVHKEQI